MININNFSKFLENISNPNYSDGEVLIFTDKSIDESFVKQVSKILGYEYVGQYGHSNNSFIIKTKSGDEEIVGKKFTDKYPEFFTGYQKLDLREELVLNMVDEIKLDVQELYDNYIGYVDDRQTIDKNRFNEDIDSIIGKLNSLKIK